MCIRDSIITRDTIMPLEEADPAEGDGLSHSGGPGAEIEEQDGQSVGVGTSIGPSPNEEAREAPDEEKGPRILKAPRVPTQKEIDEHMATHLPHQPWCEVCMKGRGRNSPHRRKKEGQRAQEERGEGSKSEDELHTGPVPRLCMDYFSLSNSCPGDRKGGQALSTKELQRQLRGMGKSDKGTRNELVKRYHRELPQEEAVGERHGDPEKAARPMPPHASGKKR